MNPSDAKEYLARREIPQLFEVRDRGAEDRGGHPRGPGRAAAPRPAFPVRGTEMGRLQKIAFPAVAGPLSDGWIRSPHPTDQVSLFKGGSGSRVPPRTPQMRARGGLQTEAWLRGSGQVSHSPGVGQGHELGGPVPQVLWAPKVGAPAGKGYVGESSPAGGSRREERDEEAENKSEPSKCSAAARRRAPAPACAFGE